MRLVAAPDPQPGRGEFVVKVLPSPANSTDVLMGFMREAPWGRIVNLTSTHVVSFVVSEDAGCVSGQALYVAVGPTT